MRLSGDGPYLGRSCILCDILLRTLSMTVDLHRTVGQLSVQSHRSHRAGFEVNPGRVHSGKLTLLLRFRHGIQAEETAFLLDAFEVGVWPRPPLELCSSFGRMARGGITRLGTEG